VVSRLPKKSTKHSLEPLGVEPPAQLSLNCDLCVCRLAVSRRLESPPELNQVKVLTPDGLSAT
jgi:hypothetical protein